MTFLATITTTGLPVRSRLVCAAILAAALLPFLPALLRGEIYTIRDHTDYFIPLRHYTAQQLLAGELPLWNPLNGSGERWLANPQTAVFYPPALMFLVFPFATAYVLYLAAHVAVLAAGAFFLFRRWAGVEGAFLAAVSLALAGPVMSLLDVSNNLGTFAWFPFVILAALRRGDGDGGYPLPVSALLLAAMFLGGEPFLAAIGAAIFLVATLSSGGRRAVSTVFASGGLAILLCAAQLLPFVEMLIGSDRAAGFASELAFRESMHPSDWVLLSLSPALTSAGLVRSSQSYIPVLYLGAPAVFLALAALVPGAWNRGNPLRRPILAFSALLALAILFSAGRYLGEGVELLSALGMNVNRYPARLVPLGALAVAGLAALGTASLRELRPAARAGLALFFALILLTASRMIVSEQGLRPSAVALLAAQLAVIGWFMFQPKRTALLVVLSIIIIPDLILASAPLRESAPYPRERPVIAGSIDRDEKIARLSDLDRLPSDVRYESMPGYTNLTSRISTISSPAPVSNASYAQFHDDALYAPDPVRLRFLSAGYLITTRSLRMNGISAAVGSGPIRVYTFDSVLPAATVWNIEGPSFLATGETRDSSTDDEPLADSVAQVLRIDSNEAIVRVSSTQDSIVILNQLDARGWTVTVDGDQATSQRAGGLFRSVRVPSGEHTVRWRYLPDFFLAGVVISVSALLLLVAMTIHLSNRARGVVGWRSHAKHDDIA